MKSKTLITAHSGADGRPDNSIEFVKYALASKSDALEVDVRKGDDGRLFLAHDARKEADTNNKKQKNAEEQVTYLKEVFSLLALHPSMLMNCDLKEADLENEVFALAQQCGVADRLIFSGTVDPRKKLLINSDRIFWNIDEQIPDLYEKCMKNPLYALEAAKDMCELCKKFGIKVINVYYKLAVDEFLKIVESYDMEISVWTVNEAEEIKHFREKGVKNITTRKLDAWKYSKNAVEDLR